MYAAPSTYPVPFAQSHHTHVHSPGGGDVLVLSSRQKIVDWYIALANVTDMPVRVVEHATHFFDGYCYIHKYANVEGEGGNRARESLRYGSVYYNK